MDEDQIKEIKKENKEIDISDDQENISQSNDQDEGSRDDELPPENENDSDGEEKNGSDSDRKADKEKAKAKTQGDIDDSEENEKEDFTDVEISSGSSNSVYLSIILNVLFILSYILEFNIADANSMNFVIQKDIDEFPYSKNPYLVMKDISSLVESMSFINSVLISNIYDKSKKYAPDKYNQTLYATANYTRPTSYLNRLLTESEEEINQNMTLQDYINLQHKNILEGRINKVKSFEETYEEMTTPAPKYRILASCTSDTECGSDRCDLDSSTCYPACSVPGDCSVVGKTACAANGYCYNSVCSSNNDCRISTAGTLPICEGSTCVACSSDSDCTALGKSKCDTQSSPAVCWDLDCADDTYCQTYHYSRCSSSICVKDQCTNDPDCTVEGYNSCFFSPNGNQCYNNPCQQDSDCVVQGSTTCNLDLNMCLNLNCDGDDYCVGLAVDHPTLGYSKCDFDLTISTVPTCYNSPCRVDDDCKPEGKSNCNPATGTCDSGLCLDDETCQDRGYTNCDIPSKTCYNNPCLYDTDCVFQGYTACDAASETCFNKTCYSYDDCDYYNSIYEDVYYGGCDLQKKECYSCQIDSECISRGYTSCNPDWNYCFNNTCNVDSDCDYPTFSNCNQETKTCFKTECSNDDDCISQGFTTCDPRPEYTRCYNATPETHYCVEDDDCGALGLLAACDNERELCVLPDDTDNSTQFYFLSSFNLFKGILMTASYNPSLDIPDNATTDPIFFDSTISLGKALSLYGKIQSYIQSGIVQELKIEYIFFNVVTQIGLYYTITLGQDSYSDFFLERHVESFYPKVFDSDSVYPDLKLTLIIFRGLFAFVLLFRILKVIIVDIYKTVKTFVQTHKLNLPLPLIFNIILLILLTFVLLISLINNFTMSGKVQTFTPPTVDDFQEMITFATNTNIFLRLLAITIFFIVLETLLLLNTQFPSFGVLFYTLGKARKELFYFLVLVFTLIAGFMVFLVLNFGLQNDQMSDISSAFVLLFQFMIGATDFRTLAAANPNWGQIFFFLFYVVFNLVLVLIFIVIIMSTYIQLRKKLQLITLALAAIASDKSKEMKDKYWKLLTCQPPAENKDGADTEDPKKKEAQAAKGKNYYEILMFNLQEVDYFGFTSNNRETRAEIENNIREKIKKIRQDRKDAKIAKAEARKSGLFKKFSGMLAHIVFMVIYLTTMDLEMRLSESYDLNQAIKIQFVDQVFLSKVGGTVTNVTYDEITTVDQIFDWLGGLYFPTIYSNWTKRPKINDTNVNVLFGQNYIIGTATNRITVRNVKLTTVVANTNQTYYLRGPDDFDIETPTQQGIEQIQPVEFAEFSVPREQEGSKLTIRRHGGYSFRYPRDLLLANYTYQVMKHPKIININTNLIAAQIVWGNPNLEIYGLSEFVLGVHPSGEVSTDYFFNEFELDMYSCYNCSKRAVMEIFYALIVLTQIYGLAKEWLKEWKKLIPWCPSCKHSGLARKEFDEEYDKLGHCPFPKCNCKCRLRIAEEKNKSKDKILKEFKFFPFVISVLKKIWELANRFLNATSAFFKKDGSNVIMTISIIFTIIGFSYLLTLVGNDFRRNSTPTVRPALVTGSKSLEFDAYEQLALTTRSYILWQSLNGWLIGLRLLFYFGFSRELSMVLEIVGEALFDIVFFIFMFFIILLGFAINGYLIFGLDTMKFRNLGRAIIQNLLIIISDNSSDYLTAVDKTVGLIYFFLFMGIFFMILLKMFIAILDGQFTDLNSGKDSTDIDKMGFFELIIYLLKENIEEIMKKVEKYEKETAKNFPEKVLKFVMVKLKTLITLIMNILLGSKLGAEEEKRLDEAREKNMMKVKLKYAKDVDNDKQREENLDGIEFYINKGVVAAKKRDEEEDDDEIPEDADNEHMDILDDEKSISHKWMITLEETLLKMSGGKLQLSKFGMHSKDFSKLEGKIAPEYETKHGDLKEIEYDHENDILKRSFINFYVPRIRIWYEEASKNKFEKPEFEKLVKHLYLVYQKTPVHDPRANEKKIEEEDKKKEEEFGNTTPKKDEKDEKDDHAHSDSKKDDTKTASPTKEKTTFNVEFKKTEIFPENNKIIDQILIDFMDDMKIEHKFELWGGYKHGIQIPEDFRNFLWSCFTFKNKHFGLNPKRNNEKKTSYIGLVKKGSSGNIDAHRNGGSLNEVDSESSPEKVLSIGSVDVVGSDNNLEAAERKRARKEAVKVSNERIIEFWNTHQSTDPMLAGSKSCIDKITKEHVELVQKLLRGPKNVYLPAEIRKFNNQKDRLKYLKKVCEDDKVILWLMTDPTTKIKMCLRMQNDVLAAFYMLLLLEEVYTNSIVVMKLEKEMNEDFKSKIYMHFFLFANFESLLHIHERQKQDDMVDQEKDMIEYIKFLENQLESSNKLKASYLEQVQKILDEDPDHENFMSSNKASGFNFLPGRDTEISVNKNGDEQYDKNYNSNMYNGEHTNEEESNLKNSVRVTTNRYNTEEPFMRK